MTDNGQEASASLPPEPTLSEQRSPADVLRAARKRIEDPRRWTKGAAARTALNKPVRTSHPSASRWCLNGAMLLESGGKGGQAPGTRFVLRALRERGHRGATVTSFNDRGLHSEVIKILDRAIEFAEAES